MSNQQEMKKVEQFFREDGSLISIPARQSKKIAVLTRIATAFAYQRKYSEKEVNEILSRYNDDTAALRRYLIENKFMDRDRDSNYWLLEPSSSVQD